MDGFLNPTVDEIICAKRDLTILKTVVFMTRISNPIASSSLFTEVGPTRMDIIIWVLNHANGLVHPFVFECGRSDEDPQKLVLVPES